MRDDEMVAAIIAGEPTGLAAAYDTYSGMLYSYCRCLLTETADAADAVQDTFVIAASKLGGLRDPDRLRSWLYAVARNVCHRRLRGRARQASLDEAGDIADTAPEAAAATEKAELRVLVADAIAGLNPGDRELIELNLRQELASADLADVLGVPLNQAHALASRARAQFEVSLGALLVARSGRESCPGLDTLLDQWDGQLSVLLRKRLNRHIDACEVCGERKRRELRPAMLLSLVPVLPLPAVAWQRLLRLCADTSERGMAHRARIARRSEPYLPSGFPVPLARPRAARRPSRAALASAAAVATIVAVASALFLLAPGDGAARDAAHDLARHASRVATAATPPSPPAVPKSPSAAPGHPAATPSPTVSAVPTSTVTARPTPSATPSPTPGELSETPAAVTLALPPGSAEPTGTFTLTAVGGPVASYAVTVPARLAGDGLSASPASGSLAAGQSVTVTVTWSSTEPVGGVLTLTPGGAQVTVSYQGR